MLLNNTFETQTYKTKTFTRAFKKRLLQFLIIALAAGFTTPLLAWRRPPAPAPKPAPGHLSKKYNQLAYVTTHNAFSSVGHGYIYAQQSQTIRKQLDSGVRALMLDTYNFQYSVVRENKVARKVCSWFIFSWFCDVVETVVREVVPGPTRVYLCHGGCGLPYSLQWSGQAQRFASALADIKNFLDANPNEVVTIILESYVKDSTRMRRTFNDAGYHNYNGVWLPGINWRNPAVDGWPTIAQMKAAGRRLVVISDAASREGLAGYTHFGETNYAFSDINSMVNDNCNWRRGPRAQPYIMNHFLTTWYSGLGFWIPLGAGNAYDTNSKSNVNKRVAKCRAALGVNPNFIAVDFHERGHGGGVKAAVQDLNK